MMATAVIRSRVFAFLLMRETNHSQLAKKKTTLKMVQKAKIYVGSGVSKAIFSPNQPKIVAQIIKLIIIQYVLVMLFLLIKVHKNLPSRVYEIGVE